MIENFNDFIDFITSIVKELNEVYSLQIYEDSYSATIDIFYHFWCTITWSSKGYFVEVYHIANSLSKSDNLDSKDAIVEFINGVLNEYTNKIN